MATLDQQWTTQNYQQHLGFNYNTQYVAMMFRPVYSGKVDSVDVYLKKSGNGGDNFSIRIWSNNGVDNSPLIAISDTQTITSSGISTSYTWYTYTFSTKPNITAETYYHIVISRETNSMTNYLDWGVDSNSGYTRGNILWGGDGSTWTADTPDADFKEYCMAAPPANTIKWNGLSLASCKSLDSLAIASVHKINNVE